VQDKRLEFAIAEQKHVNIFDAARCNPRIDGLENRNAHGAQMPKVSGSPNGDILTGDIDHGDRSHQPKRCIEIAVSGEACRTSVNITSPMTTCKDPKKASINPVTGVLKRRK